MQLDGPVRFARDVRDEAKAGRPVHVAAEGVRYDQWISLVATALDTKNLRPSRGPMLFILNMRTLEGPPNWNRSENNVGFPKGQIRPERAAKLRVYKRFVSEIGPRMS